MKYLNGFKVLRVIICFMFAFNLCFAQTANLTQHLDPSRFQIESRTDSRSVTTGSGKVYREQSTAITIYDNKTGITTFYNGYQVDVDGKTHKDSFVQYQMPLIVGSEILHFEVTPAYSEADKERVEFLIETYKNSVLGDANSNSKSTADKEALSKINDAYEKNKSSSAGGEVLGKSEILEQMTNALENMGQTQRQLQDQAESQQAVRDGQMKLRDSIINEFKKLNLELREVARASKASTAETLLNMFDKISTNRDLYRSMLDIQNNAVTEELDYVITDQNNIGLLNSRISDFIDTESSSQLTDLINQSVSFKNPNRDKNISQLSEWVNPNGVFKGSSVNLPANYVRTELSDGLLREVNRVGVTTYLKENLSRFTSTRNLVGATNVYLKRAIELEQMGRIDEARAILEKARSFGSVLSGQSGNAELTSALRNSTASLKYHEQAYRDVLQNPDSNFLELMSDVYSSAGSSVAQQAAGEFGKSWLENSSNTTFTDEEIKDVALMAADVALGIIPVVGVVKDVVELATGRNIVTGAELDTLDYIISGIGVATVGAGSGIFKIVSNVPEILGVTYKGSKVLLGVGLSTGLKVVSDFKNFVKDGYYGLHSLKGISSDFTRVMVEESPGAMLVLAQNAKKYGTHWTRDLTTHFTKNANKIDVNLVNTVSHTSRFGDGFTKFVDNYSYEKYIKNGDMIYGANKSNDVFVTTKNHADDILKQNLSLEEFSKKVGLPSEKEVDGLMVPIKGYYRIDIKFDLKYNPRVPTGSEAGVNSYFKPGGFTYPGRLPELVIDSLKKEETQIIKVIGDSK